MKLSENPDFHDKSKHIEIKYHYIRDMEQRGAVKLQYVVMDEQIADVLTNLLARVKFEYFREKLGVLQIEFPPRGIDTHEPFLDGSMCVLPCRWMKVLKPFPDGSRCVLPCR